jgi:hypothetical protein
MALAARLPDVPHQRRELALELRRPRHDLATAGDVLADVIERGLQEARNFPRQAEHDLVSDGGHERIVGPGSANAGEL